MGQMGPVPPPTLFGMPQSTGVHFKDRKNYIENLELHLGLLLLALLLALLFKKKLKIVRQVLLFVFSKKPNIFM